LIIFHIPLSILDRYVVVKILKKCINIGKEYPNILLLGLGIKKEEILQLFNYNITQINLSDYQIKK